MIGGFNHGGTQGSPVRPLLNSSLAPTMWRALAGPSPASPAGIGPRSNEEKTG